jgi:hypothetical protein
MTGGPQMGGGMNRSEDRHDSKQTLALLAEDPFTAPPPPGDLEEEVS